MNVPPPLHAHKPRAPHRLSRFFTIEPATTPGASAVSYVPFVFLSRGLAFVRLLVIARLVTASEFGLFQPAQELINFAVPIVLFGLADVAERYASRMEKEGRLRTWLTHQYRRLLLIGIIAAAVILLASPWIAPVAFHLAGPDLFHGITLVALCALTVVALSLYQHLAALLRGIRAYSASAGLEISSAILFLLFAAIAAWRGGAISLIFAYAASVILPLTFFRLQLRQYLSQPTQTAASTITTAPEVDKHPRFNRFAAWSFVRLLLMMSFSAISILGISHLVVGTSPARQPAGTAHEVTAEYSLPYRIAQLLSYVAITLWASTYGIAARAWSHGQIRRAHVQLFRVGKFGAVLLTLLAVALLLLRGLFAQIESQYADSINSLLPPLLAIFIWYGLLAFCCTFADLHESPQRGAAFWAVAVIVQLITLFLTAHAQEPKQAMILACAAGIATALLIVAPLVLWHPFRFSATAVPLVLLSVAPLSLFLPLWIVDGLAPILMLGAIAFLYISGLLIRPIDRRAWRRWRTPAKIP